MSASLYATRLKEGDDLKKSITAFVLENKLANAIIVSGVGSLSKATLRMAGAQPGKQDIRDYEAVFEIVSLIGTVSRDGNAHLHMSISDSGGGVIGGHVKDGCIVHTTVELVIASESTVTFSREVDSETGFDELFVKKHKGDV